jgi:hypothetical protein
MLEKVLDSIVPALIGAVVGLLSFFSAGWLEGEKQFEIKKADAYVEFIQKAWGTDQIAYIRPISAITVYAPPDVLDSFAAYRSQGTCGGEPEPPECQDLWAKMVNAMRRSLNGSDANRQSIVDALWGPPTGARTSP